MPQALERMRVWMPRAHEKPRQMCQPPTSPAPRRQTRDPEESWRGVQLGLVGSRLRQRFCLNT